MHGMLKKLLFVALFALPMAAFSNFPPGPPGGQAPPCEEVGLPGPGFGEPCIPIDGGISLLIAAGLAYGGKRAYDSRRRA
jgi:hypothetical protein